VDGKKFKKIMAEINESIKFINKKIQRINESKSWLFEKINKIDKLLAKLTKRKRENKNYQN
jgi:prefoldin subunit 5